MDEITRIATEALLPPVKVVGDRSCFSNNLRNEWSTKTNLAVGTLKKLISDCLFPSKEEWKTNNKDVFQLLILCGEHSIYSEWNTQELVNNVNELLDITLSKLGVQSIQDIFAVTSVTHSILQHLKPKLGKAEIKAYPAAVNCFVWVVTNTLVPSLDESVDLAVPISLVLFDDWEPDYQQKGLECMYHILKEKPTSLLHRGWLAVIFSTLKKNPAGSSDKLKLFKSLDFCLKLLNVDPTDPSSWNLNDQYDSIVNDLIQSMMIQDSPDVTKRNLEILVVLFQSMQIKMAKFLPLIISALDTHITVGVASDIILLSIKVMEQIIEYCWPCLEPQFTNQLAWILFKLGNETENEEVTHFSISKCNDLLKQISSSHSVLS